MSSSFISFHLFHLLGKDVLCLSFYEISNFMTMIVADRQTELEGLKIRHCVRQTQGRPFCGLGFDLIRWEMKWHLTGCQIMPSVILGCISWLHSPCLTWGKHPEVCRKLHWMSRSQLMWIFQWERPWVEATSQTIWSAWTGSFRVFSIASPLYLDG